MFTLKAQKVLMPIKAHKKNLQFTYLVVTKKKLKVILTNLIIIKTTRIQDT